jgi:hypothetical protein
MKNFIMPPVGHSIAITRLVTDPTSKDNPDKQAGVIGDELREVSTGGIAWHSTAPPHTARHSTAHAQYTPAVVVGDNLREVRAIGTARHSTSPHINIASQ